MDKDGNKVVQIEELSDHPGSYVGGYRVLRYLHAIRDICTGVFLHCDGAVRAHRPDEYEVREMRDFITGRASSSRYRKLFRVDGTIATDDWRNITAQWFKHNRLILEYLCKLDQHV